MRRRTVDERGHFEEATHEPRYVPTMRSVPSRGTESEVIERENTASQRAIATSLLSLSAWVGIAGLATFAILAFRMGFMMGDANPSANFVDFIYRISSPLVHPSQGIMSNRILDSGGVFESATAYAMGIYMIAMLFVMLMLWAIMPRWTPGDRTVVRRHRVAHQH